MINELKLIKRLLPDNWTVAIRILIEESPGSVKTQCQLMAGEGDFRESATEIKPPYQGKGENGEVRAHRFFGNKKR